MEEWDKDLFAMYSLPMYACVKRKCHNYEEWCICLADEAIGLYRVWLFVIKTLMLLHGQATIEILRLSLHCCLAFFPLNCGNTLRTASEKSESDD